MVEIATCLCAQIIEDGSPEPCFCGIVPGAAAVADFAESCTDGRCGMAYVRLTSTYPATQVGINDLEPGNCNKSTGFDLEIGIMRCFELEPDGGPLSPEDLMVATEQQIKDAETMRRAIDCCDAVGSRDYILGLYTPFGPDGAILGGSWVLNLVI